MSRVLRQVEVEGGGWGQGAGQGRAAVGGMRKRGSWPAEDARRNTGPVGA